MRQLVHEGLVTVRRGVGLDAPVGVLFVVGALTGCGGSWMWVAQGAYVSSLVRAERQGAVFGIFNSVFALNGVWAFFLLLVLDQSGVAPDTVAWVFAATSCCAAFSFVCVREWPPPVPQSPPPPHHHHRPPEQPKPLSAQQLLKSNAIKLALIVKPLLQNAVQNVQLTLKPLLSKMLECTQTLAAEPLTKLAQSQFTSRPKWFTI